MTSVAIVDYGMSNLHSVQHALQLCAPHTPHTDIRVVNTAKGIRSADRIVFPGQGAIKNCMQALRQYDLEEPLKVAAREKPMLGICMGLQVLMDYSQENDGVDGLGIIAGEVKHLNEKTSQDPSYKIPHLGWNQVQQTSSHPLWHAIAEQTDFYFVHSYYAKPNNESLVAGSSHYRENFPCALAKDNLFAVQFHPEKSSKQGLQLIDNFIHWQPH